MTCFRQRHREKGNILGTATGQGVGVKELGQEIEFLWHGKERGMPLTLQKNALNFSIELLKSSGQNCERFKCGTLIDKCILNAGSPAIQHTKTLSTWSICR